MPKLGSIFCWISRDEGHEWNVSCFQFQNIPAALSLLALPLQAVLGTTHHSVLISLKSLKWNASRKVPGLLKKKIYIYIIIIIIILFLYIYKYGKLPAPIELSLVELSTFFLPEVDGKASSTGVPEIVPEASLLSHTRTEVEPAKLTSLFRRPEDLLVKKALFFPSA